MKLDDAMLITTATVTALMAGFFFSYSVSVSLGLGKLANIEFVKAMQSINREVQNPLFFIFFFGTPLLLPFVTYLQQNNKSFAYLLIATLFYLVGAFGVTVFVNVPLNNKLEHFDLSTATEETTKQIRAAFEKRWAFWNNLRTISSLCSVIFAILACFFAKAK